jgi:RHS repeat-associated protein
MQGKHNAEMLGTDPFMDLSETMTNAGGIGGLLAMASSGTNYFPSYDGNGNITGLVNGTDKSTSARYEYSPFGELLRATGPMAKVNPCRLGTKVTDDESGLVYYGYRYYSPIQGRWISRDPSQERYTIMLYLAFRNQAINVMDPNGLFDWVLGLQSTATLCIATAEFCAIAGVGGGTGGLGLAVVIPMGLDAESRLVEGFTKLAAAFEDDPNITKNVNGVPYSLDGAVNLALQRTLGEDPSKIADFIVKSVELLGGASSATSLTQYVTSLNTAQQLYDLNQASDY